MPKVLSPRTINHDCLSASANFILSASILSFAGSYVTFTIEGVVQDFSFELFWHINIVLCGKEVYSLLGWGGIMGSKISKDFFHLSFEKQFLGLGFALLFCFFVL